MFVSNESMTNLAPFMDSVWEIYGSVNQPVIALPDKAPEPTWAYVIAIKKERKMQIYIYLFREQSREGVFYTNETGDVELTNAKAVFNEALDFTGSMGFIMERSELGESPESRVETIKTIPAFLADLKTYKGTQTGDELMLDTVYEDQGASDTAGKEPEEMMKNKEGGKPWLAKLLSSF